MSAPTIESAVHALTALGMVRISRGVGMFILRPREETALLNYAWRNASPRELAIVRAAIDERAPVIAAREVRDLPGGRLPRRLADINFHVNERAMQRADPLSFIRADIAFHRSILDGLRGIEIGSALYGTVTSRLMPGLLAVADIMSVDHELDDAHRALSGAILDGHVAAAARISRHIAAREREALHHVLG